MTDKINVLIEQLGDICDEFDYIADAESNWRVACRVSRYRAQVERGIAGLREMCEYLSTLSKWQLEQLQSGYLAE